MEVEVYLLLGSNKGNRLKNIIGAIKQLKKVNSKELDILEFSSLYETQPEGVKEAQPYYLNMVVKCKTTFNPVELLNLLESIEKKLGRKNKGKKTSREIDIDILLFGDMILNTKKLKIPHPQITERKFVLHLLHEISGKIFHPEYGKSIGELLSESNAEKPAIHMDKIEFKRLYSVL